MKETQSPSRAARPGQILRGLAVLCLVCGMFLASGSVLAGLMPQTTPYLASAASNAQTAEEGQAIFSQQCTGCHTLGQGKLVGPDLQGVTTRRDRQWLADFILTPDKLIAAKDPTAMQLLAESNNVAMPNLGLTAAQAEAVLVYLESDAAGAGPAAAAPAASTNKNPLAGRAGIGEQLFNGTRPLRNGGTSCIACHTVNGTGELGGGSLGPDLTNVFTRYGGQAGLAGAMSTLPFPTMKGIFVNAPLTPDEQADLVAYFAAADREVAQAPATLTWTFFGGGVIGAGLLFGMLSRFWPRQRQSLSDRLRASGRKRRA